MLRRAGPAAALTAGLSAVFIARTSFTYEGHRYFSLFDDSMVSMTFARNLAEGHGLVWNAGGERVEGFTNLLWTLWMAVIHLLGAPASTSSLWVMLSGVALLLGTLFVVRALAARLSDAPAVPTIAMLLTAVTYPLLFWTLRGMEVGLLALLCSTALLLALRLDARWSGRDAAALAAVLSLAVLTRDDALVWAAVIVGFVAMRSRRAALMAGATVVAVMAAKTGFRVAYYGEALPNTYALKVAGVPIADRLRRGIVSLVNVGAAGLWAPAALTVVAVLRAQGERRRAAQLIATVFAALCAYVVYAGGDVWEFLPFADRYLSPALPALMAAAAAGAYELVAGRGGLVRALVAVALGVAALNGLLAVHGPAHDELVRLSAPAARTFEILGALGAAAGLALLARSQRPWRWSLAVVAAAVALIANGHAFGDWAVHGAPYAQDDAQMSRYGLLLGEVAPPGASVAVTWAGAIPYFARRPAVDLLGKSDPVIARSPRHPVPFSPGHDKWDYDYSLGRLRPALVAQLWTLEPGLSLRLASWGYQFVGAQPLAGGTVAELLARPSIPPAAREELRRRLPGIVAGS